MSLINICTAVKMTCNINVIVVAEGFHLEQWLEIIIVERNIDRMEMYRRGMNRRT